MTTLKVPFDSAGNMMRYETAHTALQDLGTFEAALEYDGCDRGRSAMTFYWRHTETGKRYPMFLHDFDKMVKDAVFAFGRVWGVWSPVKKSGYFGIVFVPPESA